MSKKMPAPSVAAKAANHTGQEPTPTIPSGLGLLGRPLAPWRRQRAYDHAKAMGLPPEHAEACVSKAAAFYGRDKPYEAEQSTRQYLDLTGHYRLMAALLADPEDHLLLDAHKQEGWPLPDGFASQQTIDLKQLG